VHLRDFTKTLPARFLLDSGKPAILFLGEDPSRPGWARGLGTACLLVVSWGQLSKAGGRGGFY